MKVIVTGVAGFIGSHVAANLVANGHSVIGLDDLSGGFLINVPKGVEFVHGSICNELLIETLFARHQFEAVIHLAAYAAEGLSHYIKRFNYKNNLDGSVNLLSCAVNHGSKVFVFSSSIAVYGSGKVPFNEMITPRPQDPYGIAKYAFELELKATRRIFGLPYVIFRPHNVYGPFQNITDPYRNVIGIFMRQVIKGERMIIFGDGYQTRAFSYIDDVAPIISAAIEKPEVWNQVFNVGSDTPHEVLSVAEEIARAFDVRPQIMHMNARDEAMHAYCSNSKMRDFFGVNNVVPLREGVRRMAEWVMQRGIPEPTLLPRVEIPHNLPSSWTEISLEDNIN